MAGVGVPGGRHHRSPGNRGKAQEKRQSDAGRQARRLYNQRPDVKAHKTIIRKMKRHLKGGY